MILDSTNALDTLTFADGLIPVIAQNAATGEVLMLGYANRDALERTMAEGVLWFYSRSRATLWRKGETSGNVLRMISLHADCDRDAVVALVEPAGPACHTGDRSCFGASPTLLQLADTIAERARGAADGSYTRRLLENGNLRLKKLGEEAVELALACANGDENAAAEEGADLIYHAMVACFPAGATLDDVLRVLERRRSAGQAATGEQAVEKQ